MVSSCTSLLTYEKNKIASGKFNATNGEQMLSFNISIQNNPEFDIIQIKKPFYGNVFTGKINKKYFSLVSDIPNTNEGLLTKNQEKVLIKWLYQCMQGQTKLLEKASISATCAKKSDAQIFNINLGSWVINGLIR